MTKADDERKAKLLEAMTMTDDELKAKLLEAAAGMDEVNSYEPHGNDPWAYGQFERAYEALQEEAIKRFGPDAHVKDVDPQLWDYLLLMKEYDQLGDLDFDVADHVTREQAEYIDRVLLYKKSQ